MDLRSEQPADHRAVRDLHLAAFGDHGRVVAALVDGLRRDVTAGNGLSLVAAVGEEVVGHVMFTRSLLDAPRRLVGVQVLSPVAVRTELKGQGIGSALIRRGLDVMAARVPIVFLEGRPTTTPGSGLGRAEQGFRKPSLRIPDGAFQALRLPAYESWIGNSRLLRDLLAARCGRATRP